MTSIIHIQRRVTHRYNDGWAYNDQWEGVGKAKLLAQRMVRAPEGFDDGGEYVRYAVLAAGVDREKGAQALADTARLMYGNRCQHEHDCCGCAHSTVQITHVKGRSFRLNIRIGFNY